MADFVQNLDGKSLLYVGTGIVFAISAWTSPTYNLPIFLFAIYAFERESNNESLRYATGLLAGSMILDLIWLIKTKDQHGFIKAMSIIVLILKAPTVLTLVQSLRSRGDGGFDGQFSGGNTIWSMPGGFASSGGGGGGYQALGGDREDDIEQARPVPPAPVRNAPPPLANNHPAPARPPPSGP